jgi:hypothetical protein
MTMKTVNGPRPRFSGFSVAPVLLALALVAVPVRATVLLPADLSELARQATTIARGRVVAVEARWLDGRGRIETIVTLEAERYLKGGEGSALQFRVPGGRLGRYRNVVVGAPEFAVGQRVIVFLGASGAALPYTLGLGQGVFRVAAGQTDWLVTSPAVLPRTGAPLRIVRGDATRRPLPLVDFEERVRELAGAVR